MAERFHPDYIELMRKVALPREWQPGDWWAWLDSRGGEPGVHVTSDANLPRPSNPAPHHHEFFSPHGGHPGWSVSAWWLPTTDDWLDMLEGEGHAAILGVRPARDGSGYGVQTDEGDDSEAAFGPDRLTALARLWLAVTGREVAE